MDFWSRLIGGGRLPPAKPANNSPEQRLSRFKRATEQILHLWRRSKGSSISAGAVADINTCLESLRRILLDETRASVPHLCIEYAASAQIYLVVTQVASLCATSTVAHEVISLLNVLVECEEGEFLQNPGFANATTNLALKLSVDANLEADVEAGLFELLFSIAAKLKLQPECIAYWFKPNARRGTESPPEPSNDKLLRSREQEFPLFYLLLGNLHHERRVGEFARTGLLYIIESTAHSEALEKWVIESDLAAMMASGLGALYSQLNRKLVYSYTEGAIPAVIAFSETSQSLYAVHNRRESFANFQASVDAFSTYLSFWQDIMEQCVSADIRQTLLDHFKILFLQQLLYPSLLESSDRDGSSVAVLDYLRLIFETITHIDFIHCVLQYLLALSPKPADNPQSARPPAVARRRKSETIISQLTNREEVSPDLFNLLDLILTSLRSQNQQTVTATLRLLTTLLGPQHRYAATHLLKIIALDGATRTRSIDDHERELNTLLGMADSLVLDDELEISYESYLQDASTTIEAHYCSAQLLALPYTGIDSTAKSKQSNLLRVHPYTIRPDDPSLQSLLSLFDRFLGNDIETNLSLTQVLACLASCGFTRLEGWLLSNPDHGEADPYRQSNSLEKPHSGALQNDMEVHSLDYDPESAVQPPLEEREDPNTDTASSSPVFQSLDALVKQVQHFCQEIEDFDVYLAERKHVFKVGDEIDSALKDQPAPPRRSQESKATSPRRNRNVQQITSISERLMSENSSAAVSRSTSPRGRQRGDQTAPTLIGRLSHLRISPSPSPSKTASSAHSRSPFRKGSLSSTPPQGLRSPISAENALRQKIKVPVNARTTVNDVQDVRSSDGSSVRSDSVGSEVRGNDEAREVSLSHLLTNVIILQEFLLELAAIIEVRASLFGEVSLE